MIPPPKLPIARPTPEAPNSRPKPKSPALKDDLAMITSPTLMHATPSIATLHAEITVCTAGERLASAMPSARARQCPRLGNTSDWRRRAGIIRRKNAEKTNEPALTQYAECGPD